MSRSFRVYQKKRGTRRTGSKVWASVGEAVFFTCIFAIGALVLVLLLKRLVIPEWRANHSFVETTCVVEQIKPPLEIPDDDGPTYVPLVEISYEVAGEKYTTSAYDIAMVRGVKLARPDDERTARELVADFEVGETYRCWYDPADPQVAVLIRGYTWWLWALLLLPVAFIGIGGAGLAYVVMNWGKSAERRAATQFKSPTLDPSESEVKESRDYPYVPGGTNLTNSPGTILAYRLPIHTPDSWYIVGGAAAVLVWNGIVLFFAISAIRGIMQGRPDWLHMLFVLPFLAAGIYFVYKLIKRIVVITGAGPTQVEISDHPLVPGGTYQVVLIQAGHSKIRKFELSLVCEEEVSFHQGTDIRIERKQVYQQKLLERGRFEITTSSPFQHQCEITIPGDVMHSFKGGNSEIQWKLVATFSNSTRATFERRFPVVVYPVVAETSLV